MDIIYGMGELGNAIYNLFAINEIKVMGYDTDKSKCKGLIHVTEQPEIIHICIPYSENFVKTVLEIIESKISQYVIIHSTIPPNTTQIIQDKTERKIVFSPTRGVHSRFLNDMMRYTKFYSYYGEKNMSLMDCFSKRFSPSRYVKNPVTLELAKILTDTTYYGLLIAYRKIVDDYSESYGVRGNDVWQFAEEIHEFLGNRPVMFNDKKPIGGHCVIPNLDLIVSPTNALMAIKSLIKNTGESKNESLYK